MSKKNDVKTILDEWLSGIPAVRCYSQKMKIYAPTCKGKCEGAVKKLETRVNEILLGSTTYKASGCWWDDEKKDMVCEPNHVIEAAHNCHDKKTLAKIASAIADYAVEANQTDMAILNNHFYLAQRIPLVEYTEELQAQLR